MARTANLYSEYIEHRGRRARVRSVARNAAVSVLAAGRQINQTSGWLRCPFYHHVFDDEVAGFDRQLRYMRRFGEFISVDEAIALVTVGDPLESRYFCLTFDDGYRNHFTNALPVLDRLAIPAAFFVVTGLIGTNPENDDALLARHFRGSAWVEFMDWQECREMTRAGMAIGSHTATHADLMHVDDERMSRELSDSKMFVESQLNTSCDHFSCPFGIPGVNFTPGREPALAAKLGYHSFFTGQRGAMRPGDSAFFVKRDQLLANWHLSQVRYFVGG